MFCVVVCFLQSLDDTKWKQTKNIFLRTYMFYKEENKNEVKIIYQFITFLNLCRLYLKMCRNVFANYVKVYTQLIQ